MIFTQILYLNMLIVFVHAIYYVKFSIASHCCSMIVNTFVHSLHKYLPIELHTEIRVVPISHNIYAVSERGSGRSLVLGLIFLLRRIVCVCILVVLSNSGLQKVAGCYSDIASFVTDTLFYPRDP